MAYSLKKVCQHWLPFSLLLKWFPLRDIYCAMCSESTLPYQPSSLAQSCVHLEKDVLLANYPKYILWPVYVGSTISLRWSGR